MLTRRLLFLTPAQAVTTVFPPLRDAGYELGIAENLKGASVFIRKSGPGIIFARPVLPGFRVEDLLAVGAEDPNFPPVIVITDKGTAEEAERLTSLEQQQIIIDSDALAAADAFANITLLARGEVEGRRYVMFAITSRVEFPVVMAMRDSIMPPIDRAE